MSLRTQAFPVSNRLTDKGCFSRVFDKPVYTTKTPFVSVLAGTGSKPWARLGIVVAKRNVKLAVDRNRLKRLVRESFRQQQQDLQGLDIVVVVKRDFDQQAQAANLPGLFQRVGIKCCKNSQLLPSTSTDTL